MDPIARYNVRRWRALAEANALFTRPALDLDPERARSKIDPEGLLGDLAGKRVLCLASGGGQQSVAFALLDAIVTVADLSEEQLERDRQAAEHYGLSMVTVQADMRDLSELERAGFDIVWQGYSLSFVPEPGVVFREVAGVLARGGLYYVAVANPFALGITPEDWNGEGYTLRYPYQDGLEITTADANWVYDRTAGEEEAIPPAREYLHKLSTLINGVIDQDFVITRLSDDRDLNPEPDATPGTWSHLISVAPPWISIWARRL
ncbi:MAG: class I SAM-dependent methyltransferase [Chloroflexia bacterium]